MKNPQKCCILNAGLPPKFNQLASYNKQLWGGKQPIDMMMILTPHIMLPCLLHSAKMDFNKKWLPKQKTIQNFNIDAQGFRKTRNENPPTRKIRFTS